MGRYSVISGALTTVAFCVYIDGMSSLDQFLFIDLIPFMLSVLGFSLLAFVDPIALAHGSSGDSAVSAFSADHGSGLQQRLGDVREKSSWVFGIMMCMISTALSITFNATGAIGCASAQRTGASGSTWPGFALVLQSIMWLGAATALFVDKAASAYDGRDGPMLQSSD
jgi:hypothetical protein